MITFILGLFVTLVFAVSVVALHEYGHYYVYKMNGCKVESIRIGLMPIFKYKKVTLGLIPFGGEVVGDFNGLDDTQKLLVSSAGLIVNFAVGMVSSFLFLLTGFELLYIYAMMHLSFIVINAIPFHHLDGMYIFKHGYKLLHGKEVSTELESNVNAISACLIILGIIFCII